MLSVWPLDVTEEEDCETPANWRENGYFDDHEWIVTYQKNKYSQIEDLFIGSKQEAIKFFDDFIEDWG